MQTATIPTQWESEDQLASYLVRSATVPVERKRDFERYSRTLTDSELIRVSRQIRNRMTGYDLPTFGMVHPQQFILRSVLRQEAWERHLWGDPEPFPLSTDA